MMELNREQIIKGLEYCTDALALINSQEQRIKELTEENERLKANAKSATEILNFKFAYDAGKADTVRKMQNELKKTFSALCKGEMGDLYRIIDQIAREMLEGVCENTTN